MEADKPEESAPTPAVDMELEAAGGGEAAPPEDGAAAGSTTRANGVHEPEENGAGKREREEGGEDEGVKKQKVERSVEEDRLERVEEGKEGVEAEDVAEDGEKDEDDDGKEVDGASVKLGPKSFGSSVGMFEYFYKLLHTWSPNLDINRYEFMVLMDLINNGHPEPDKKIGGGIQAFQVRYHPLWKSRCFFLVRVDGSSDDFSFRKCVDHILPLPDNMKAPDGKRSGGNQKGGGRGGRGRGGGRGGRWRRGGFGK